jgi:8-oxo-dGTP pyrophosphatase MutT (NUDIX family)
MGGGLLPVARRGGEIVFLFGREASGGKWSDFGGGREGRETHWQTAIREGAEELCGFLGSERNLAARVRQRAVAEVRVGLGATYVFEIDYDPLLPVYFNNNHRFIAKHLPQIVGADNGLFEKSVIEWFSLADLRKRRRSFRRFYQGAIDELLLRGDEIAGNMVPCAS